MLDGTTNTIDEPAEGQCTLTLSCIGNDSASTADPACAWGELGTDCMDDMPVVPERLPVNEAGVTGRSVESTDAGVMERISGCGGLIALSKLCIVVALGMGGGCWVPPGYTE